MYQIDNSSAVAEMPNPAAAGSPGYFTDGDAVGGVPGTILPADFLNALMVELLGVLAAVGIAPSKTTRNQLASALPKISGNSVVFPSGLIVNFGTGTHTDGSGGAAVVFPTPFKQGVLVSLASNKASGPPTAFHGTGGETLTGMTVYSSTATGMAAGAGTAFNYIAIGR